MFFLVTMPEATATDIDDPLDFAILPVRDLFSVARAARRLGAVITIASISAGGVLTCIGDDIVACGFTGVFTAGILALVVIFAGACTFTTAFTGAVLGAAISDTCGFATVFTSGLAAIVAESGLAGRFRWFGVFVTALANGIFGSVAGAIVFACGLATVNAGNVFAYWRPGRGLLFIVPNIGIFDPVT